jgi:hypothetical protein
MKWLRIFKRKLPAPIAVTFEEGGEGHRFPLSRAERDKIYTAQPWHGRTGITVHSILFDDGSAWDAVNGWRDDSHVARLHGCSVAQYRRQRLGTPINQNKR